MKNQYIIFQVTTKKNCPTLNFNIGGEKTNEYIELLLFFRK